MLKTRLADLSRMGASESVVAPELIQNQPPVFWSLIPPSQTQRQRLHAIRYLCDVVCLTVFAPEEWLTLFAIFKSEHECHDARKHHAAKTVDSANEMRMYLNEIGMTAYIKSYGGMDYLIVAGYQEALIYLWTMKDGQTSTPQMLRLGVGSLNTDNAYTTSVHVLALLDVFVGIAISEVQYIINDARILKQLGISRTTMITNALSVTSASLTLNESFPVSKIVGLGLVLVSVLLTIHSTDKDQVFEAAMAALVFDMLAVVKQGHDTSDQCVPCPDPNEIINSMA